MKDPTKREPITNSMGKFPMKRRKKTKKDSNWIKIKLKLNHQLSKPDQINKKKSWIFQGFTPHIKSILKVFSYKDYIRHFKFYYT